MRPEHLSAGLMSSQRCFIREQHIEAATYRLDLTAKLSFPNLVHCRLPQFLGHVFTVPPAIIHTAWRMTVYGPLPNCQHSGLCATR